MALASAIDRKKLAAQSYSNALAFAATGMLPPMLGSTPDLIMHDLARARELLAQAGVKPPGPLVLTVIPVPRPYLPEPRATTELIAAQLGELGLKVEIKQPRDLCEYQEIAAKGAYDLLLAGWIPDTSDPLDFMQSLLGSDCIPGKPASRGSNFSRWRDTTLDQAIERHRTRAEPETWKGICDVIRDEIPLFPLMYGPRIAVVSWRTKHFPREFGSGPFLSEVELPSGNETGRFPKYEAV
jgi:ABC-type transport system substrate-binding protein